MGLSESGFAHRANWKVMGWEKAACLVLGRQSPAGFGIHSKFNALVANIRLLTPKGVSEQESLRGTPRALWGPLP